MRHPAILQLQLEARGQPICRYQAAFASAASCASAPAQRRLIFRRAESQCGFGHPFGIARSILPIASRNTFWEIPAPRSRR